jgi:hypothetical protein
MAAASNSVVVSNAIEASPSDTSLRSLDAVNLLLAGALSDLPFGKHDLS